MKWISTLLIIALSGCYPLDYDPHQTFLSIYGRAVGKDARAFFSSVPDGVLLNNDLIEIAFNWRPRRNCVTYYQYDPKTYIVKSWRWEGDECTASF